MLAKKYIFMIIVIFSLTSAFGFVFFESISPEINSTDDVDNTQRNSTHADLESITDDLTTHANSDWELVLSSKEIFVDGETGSGYKNLKFTIDSVDKLEIKMHVISELCVSCGGSGKGEVSVVILMPSGEPAFQKAYTESGDIDILQSHPLNGEWQIIIEGVAVGDAYRIGYSTVVYTLDLEIE
jgi:hypothetical protein